MKQVTSIAAIIPTIVVLLLICAACSGGTESNATVTPSQNTTATADVPTLAPTSTSAAVAVQSTQSVTQPVTQSVIISPTINNAADPADSGLPVAIAALLPTANPVHGGELARQNGCSACHSLDEGVKVVGPSWYNLANNAATRIAGKSAPLYLYHSITLPNQHILEGFLPNLMPQTYADQLGEQDMADLIAYLLTL